MHSTAPSPMLKLAAALAASMPLAVCGAQTHPDAEGGLRDELTALLTAGRFEDAVRRAQQALGARPGDAAVQREYVDLHLSLARIWLAQRRIEAAAAALGAVRAVEPQHPQAGRLLEEIRAARARAGQAADEIDRLLRLELFEAALDRISEAEALRPDLAPALRDRMQAARLGAADDHYLAGNFAEALALYESLIVSDPESPPALHSRWAVALALALGEGDFAEPTDPNAAGRLLARAIDVLRRTREPVLGRIIGGLLAEQAGQWLDAGRTYAEALGEDWELPPVDRRREAVRALRQRALERARQLYADTSVGRRDGFWAVALREVWKQRQTPHFDVYARNDLVAERLAEAAEFHLAGIGAWLAAELPAEWSPRCELRAYASREELHEATGTRGVTFAVSHTRVQGDRVLLRRLAVFQADPWLLSSTLPHELTHLLLADLGRSRTLPLALEEGLALQAEPPARRLMYRRLLPAARPAVAGLLAEREPPADVEGFYAQAGALAGWLLHCLGGGAAPAAGGSPAGLLRELYRGEWQREWWQPLGFESQALAESAWSEWYAARGDPYRMPLMILAEPAAEHRRTPRAE